MLHLLHLRLFLLINRLRRDEGGAALVEYGLLIGLIAVICIGVITIVGTQISTLFSAVAGDLAAV